MCHVRLNEVLNELLTYRSAVLRLLGFVRVARNYEGTNDHENSPVFFERKRSR